MEPELKLPSLINSKYDHGRYNNKSIWKRNAPEISFRRSSELFTKRAF